jgi:hypothetical protein
VSGRREGPDPPDRAALSVDDGMALLARVIADDIRRGGGRGGAAATAPPSATDPGRRGRYKPRHPIHAVMVSAARRARAA